MAKEQKTAEELTIWDDAKQMIEKARRDGVETAWDRYETQSPHCNFCELGLTCKNCNMGPCRISPKEGGKMKLGVCGADAHVIVARNFGRFVAGGAAGHSDHGRDLMIDVQVREPKEHRRLGRNRPGDGHHRHSVSLNDECCSLFDDRDL